MKNKLIIVSIAILVSIIILLGGYILFNKYIDNKSCNKIDCGESLVYNAKYTYPVSSTSYIGVNGGETYSLSDIVVPYVNINSADAIKVNKEIKALYNKMATDFKSNLTGDKTEWVKSSYKSYTNGDVLSIIISTVSGGTDTDVNLYYTYNFNLKTLKYMSYSDVCKAEGLTALKVNSEVEKIITTEFDSFNSQMWTAEQAKENYINSTIDGFNASNKDDTIFINDNNTINMVVDFNVPAGAGNFYKIISIE